IVPRIGEFRPQLEAQATRALGVPVRVGHLSARTEGLIPSFELLDVALLDPQGRPALLLPRVVVALSPRSLMRWGFDQLYIESPELDIRRTAQGRLLVAGLEVAQGGGDSNALADWLFSQGEVIIRNGTLRWTDELRGAPPLALSQVQLLLRNGNWRHQMRVDATPPAEWGDRFSLTGHFRAPLLRARDGDWRQWSGQLYADFTRVDVSRLRQHADLGVEVADGRGALRAWADVQRGVIVGGTADLALADVNATLGAGLEPLALSVVQGRVGGRRLAGGFEFSTQGLQFTTADGLVWPGGNLRLTYTEATGRQPAQGEIRADRLDIGALASIATRLPLEATVHRALDTYAPQGLIDEIQASWRGPFDALQQYQLRGRMHGFALAAPPDGRAADVPGLRGAQVDIDMNQAGGKATVGIRAGALVLPGVFEDPVLPLDRLSAQVRWQLDGARISVQASDVEFANADVEGQARATWRTADVPAGSGQSRFPGVLDLSGTLSRADGTRVHRYLPLTIPADARHYVRDAVQAGRASQVQFKVRGDLHHLPFNDPRQGEFRIAAKVQDVTYAYVPPRLLPEGSPRWPALTQLAGELIFERSSMQVRGASGAFSNTPGLRLSKVEARIPDLNHTVVGVSAEARGPLSEVLTLVNQSPLAGMTGNALAQAAGSGAADLQLRLSLPIGELARSRVQGSVQLAGNELRITPETPPLTRLRGAVQFTEAGFSLAGVQGRALGGDLRIDGGMRPQAPNAPATEPTVQIRVQGTATAEGLQQTRQLGALAQFARLASGSAPYTLALNFRRGHPELSLSTSLQGMALALPAPLGKSAESSVPVRLETQLTRESLLAAAAAPRGAATPLRETVQLDWAGAGSAQYLREWSGGTARVLRGSIGLGLAPGESPPAPVEGVAANVQWNALDVDAWRAVLARVGAAPGAAAVPGGAFGPEAAMLAAASGYGPTTLALRARTLTAQGRTFRNVAAGAQRTADAWRASVAAQEFSGYVEYQDAPRPGAAGRLYARLSRVNLPQSDAHYVEGLLEQPQGDLPALDLVVDDFELRGRRLGRVEIEAQNRGGDAGPREWRLSKFNMATPEATLTATGNWALLGQAGAEGRTAEKRTALSFKLDIRDSGELLTRFGMPGVMRRGKGRMEGQVGWIGTPMSPDYRSMSGQIHLDLEAGQFLKAEPGLAKLLGVLSLQSLPRRLTLDFRDVFSEGFAFDFVRGDTRIERGLATTNNLQMKGVNAAVLMEGSVDIDRETQDLRVVVVPEINAMTASLVATAINPVIGLGSFLAQVFLRGPLIEAATQEFRIDGTWTDPRVVRVPRRARDTDANPAAAPPPASRVPAAEPAPRTGEPS
ncbi:MAG: YhdP family protein, partial [Burkholderiaceae bacterium]